MPNSIQAMRYVYDISKASKDNGAPLTDEIIQMLLEQTVKDSELIKKYRRFEKGYAAEDLFMRIYSMLPWVKLITPLGQEQFPECSKAELQVADYEVTYEVRGSGHTNCVLVEAKLVDGEKQTHELKKYQYDVLQNYADKKGMGLLFALFWRKHGIWTVVPIDVFDEKSSVFKISYFRAYMNDVSAIFGDYSYVFEDIFYRKSVFSSEEEVDSEYFHGHEKYGRTIYEGLSGDGDEYEDLSFLEPPVLDCAFDFTEKTVNIEGDKTELVEKVVCLPYVYRLSLLILKYLLKIYCYDPSDMYCHDNEVVKNAFGIVDTVRRKCYGRRYYLMPERNPTSIRLFQSQFGGVRWIINAFEEVDRTNKDFVLLASHDNLDNI